MASPATGGPQCLRIKVLLDPARPSALQGTGAGRAFAGAAPEDLRSARQPHGKGLRADGAGEDQAVLGRGTQPGYSGLPYPQPPNAGTGDGRPRPFGRQPDPGAKDAL